MMQEAVIIDAIRTPIGRVGGALARERPDDLMAHVLSALVDRTEIDPAIVDDVFVGCANQAGEDNRNVSRMSTLLAGFPDSVPGVTVNRLCASGLEAVNQAAKAVIAGEGDVFIAGGVESMSRAPFVRTRDNQNDDDAEPVSFDTMLGWRLINPSMEALNATMALGETAEIIADEMGITREDQDAFALESHRRAVDAIRKGRFSSEIAPVKTRDESGAEVLIDTDEHPRFKRVEGDLVLTTSLERLAKLGPFFREDGTVTAGNASGLNDGAAALLIMSARRARQLGFDAMVKWVGSAAAGVHPSVMGYGPVPSTNKLLERLGLSLDDVGLVELNEAFAAQSLGVIRRLGLDPAITNVNGGAVALGHPLGCSGARILTTLIHEMKRRSSHEPEPYYGLATMCVGVGQGVSTVVEWANSSA